MTRQFNAHFQNGVLIPDGQVELPENRKLTVIVDEWGDEANDPRPTGGVELVKWRARHRMKIDPEIAREIAENPEFNIENS